LEGFAPEGEAVRRAAEPDRAWAVVMLLVVVAFRSVAWFGLITFVPLWEVSLGHSKAYGNHLLSLMLLVVAIGTLAAGPLPPRPARRRARPPPGAVRERVRPAAAHPDLRPRGRHPWGGRARLRRHLCPRHVRGHDGHEPGVPAAPRGHGVRTDDRAVDRAR